MKACYKAQELHQLREWACGGRGPGAGRGPDYLFVNSDYSLVKVLFFADIIRIEGVGVGIM